MRYETTATSIELVVFRADLGEWAVRWDFKPKEGEEGIYWYEEETYTWIPTIEDIKRSITEWQNKQTNEAILYGYEWNGKKVYMTDENKFNFKSIFDIAVFTEPQVIAWDAANPDLAGKNYVVKDVVDEEGNSIQTYVQTGRPISVFPTTFKLGTNEEPNFHEFTSLNELQDFYLGGMNWIQSCYQGGWIKNNTFDYTPYEEALAAL